jgi:predicted kinase
MLIAMAGLPGTGKSTLAQQMAHALSGTVLDKDTIRAVLFPPALLEYTTEQDDFCMSILFQAAGYILRKDPHQHVILDGRTFSHRYQVEAVKDVAAQLKTHLKIIECICSDEVARQRLRGVGTAEIKHLAGNRDYALYLALKARFEEIDEPKLLVNTEDEPQHCLEQCLSYILETRPQ